MPSSVSNSDFLSAPLDRAHDPGAAANAQGAAAPVTQARSTPCLMCGGRMRAIISDLVDNRLGTPGEWQILQCSACGFEQTGPMPTQSELTALYESHYNFGGQTDTLYTRLREKFLLSSAYRLWTRIDGDVAFHSRRGHGRLLDVGCNEGRSLRIFARNGFDQLEGLEVNENAAAVARKAGSVVYTCLIDEFVPAKPYDVAILSNVLEHSLDPRKMLTDVNRVLAPGGKVWISLPNSQSWLRKAFGRSWINWHVPFHISHFSAATLGKLLAETGFSNIEIQQVSPALWVAQSTIAYLFAKPGTKTWQLRNPFLTLLFMALARFVAFPKLWFENRRGHGDCLLVVATRK
jgi:2-polyprenyl-3-methyl-5-hydroxy-6-metoxy-1,4-benzoquinol methylase